MLSARLCQNSKSRTHLDEVAVCGMSALSLKCQDCGTQLKSAKECQEHAEVCPRMLHRLRALVLESALTADEAHEFRRVHRRDIESRVQRVWEALQVLMTPQRVEDRLKRLLRPT